jgi:hypothetical protein
MVGTQFHPEFLSRPNRPHPLFRAFVAAVAERDAQRAAEVAGEKPAVKPGNGRVEAEKSKGKTN